MARTKKELIVGMKAEDGISDVVRNSVNASVRQGRRIEEQVAKIHKQMGLASISSKRLLQIVSGALIVKAGREVLSFARNSTEELELMDQTSKRTGLSLELLSTLRIAGGALNQDLQDMADLAGDVGERVAEAATQGSGPGVEVLKRLNINARDVNGQLRDTESLLLELIEKIPQVESLGEREFLLKEIGGDQAARLLGVIDRFEEFRDDAERFGGIVTQEDIDAALQVERSLERMDIAVFGIRNNFVREFGPDIANVIDGAAARLASVPDSVRALTFGVGQALGGDDFETRNKAQRLVGEVVNTGLELALATAGGIGETIAVGAVEALVFGLRASAPSLSDIWRDIVGPVLSEIPGVDIDQSVAGQLAELQEQLLEVPGSTLRRIDEIQREIADLAGGVPQGLSFLERPDVGALEAERSRLLRESGVNPDLFRRRDELTRQFTEQERKRAEDFKNAFDEFVGRVSSSYRDGYEEIDSAQRNFGRALDRLGDLRTARTSVESDAPQVVEEVNNVGGAFTRMALDAAEAGVSLSGTIDQLVRGADTLGNLNARRLDATGFDREAERVRLLLRFTQERRELLEKGGVSGAFVGRLEETQRLELARFDLLTEADEIMGRLVDAEEAYQKAIERRADAVEAGSLKQSEATARNRADQEELEALVKATREGINELASREPELVGLLDRYRTQLDETAASVRASFAVTGGTFVSGFRTAIRDFRREANDTSRLAEDLTRGSINSIVDNTTDATVLIGQNFRNLEDVGRETLRNISSEVARLSARFVVLRLVSGAASIFGGGGGPSFEELPPGIAGPPALASGGGGGGGFFGLFDFLGNAQGGTVRQLSTMQSAAGRGFVAGFSAGRGVPIQGFANGTGLDPRDTIPGMLREGEEVLTPEQARAYRSGRGGGSAGTVIVLEVNVTVTGGSSSAREDSRRGTMEGIVQGITRVLPYMPAERESLRVQLGGGL